MRQVSGNPLTTRPLKKSSRAHLSYHEGMKARALVALGSATRSAEERAEIGLAGLERAIIEGEGDTWEAAQAACPIPEGAFIMHWMKSD